ncbi:MAG: hypothetical protein M1490_04850 [Candidatus Bathyarchaeota archaeon]|nr:hypothetical protein [Candidatus Bathyarchaeota archaeon]
MKGKRRKIAVIAGIILLLVSGLSAVFVLFFSEPMPQKTQNSTSQYLLYRGSESRIAMVSATSSFTPTNQTYTSADGQRVIQDGGLYTINLTLRNDYTSENPPPSTGTPTAPIDGTAYLCLKATLLAYDVVYPSINLSPSDFATTSADQTGLVLASGQTNTVQLILATNQTNINDFFVTLISITDSIPH